MAIEPINPKISDLEESRRSLIRWIILAAIGLSLFEGISWWRSALRREIGDRLNQIRQQGLPTNGIQLNQWIVRPSPQDNAALKILEAFDAISLLPPKFTELKPVDRKSAFPLQSGIKSTLQLVCSNNIAALNSLDQAGELSQGDYLTDWSPGANTLLPHLAKVKTLASLLRVKATLALDETNSATALQSIREIFTLAHSLAPEPCMVSQLVRIQCGIIAMDELDSLLERCPVKDEERKMLFATLKEAERENEKGPGRALVGERCMGTDIFRLSTRVALTFDSEAPKSRSILYSCLEFTGLHEQDFLFYLKKMDARAKALDSPFSEQAARKTEADFPKHRMFLIGNMLAPSLQNILEKTANLKDRFVRAEAKLKPAK